MAGTSSPAMAAEVSNAGGLGSLGVAAMGAEGARAAIAEFRDRSSQSVNVNVFCHATPGRPTPALEARVSSIVSVPSSRRFEAAPPASLRSMYTSFLADDAMLAVLARREADGRQLPLRGAAGRPVTSAPRGRHRARRAPPRASTAQSWSLPGCKAIVAQGYEAGGPSRSFQSPKRRTEPAHDLALHAASRETLPVPGRRRRRDRGGAAPG